MLIFAVVFTGFGVSAQAQPRSEWGHSILHHLPGIHSHGKTLTRVTPDQRRDLARCFKTTARIEKIANQMARVGHRRGHHRVDYTSKDLLVLKGRERALKVALTAMTTDHDAFIKSLSHVRNRDIAKRIHRLHRLQVTLHSDNSKVAHDLISTRPGTGSVSLPWDVNTLGRAVAKWKAEHTEIARDLELAI
jgi:hypothetical protein